MRKSLRATKEAAMTSRALFANNLAAEREAKGIGTAEELARRAGIEPSLYAKIEAGAVLPSLPELNRLLEALGGADREKLYPFGLQAAIGGGRMGYEDQHELSRSQLYRELREPTRLLIHRDEIQWLEHAVEPDGDVDVFVNLSCSTQKRPHLMLDIVSVFSKLGVRFAAGVGTAFCCGGTFRAWGNLKAGERMAEKSEEPALARGASTHVHHCTQCVNNFTATANRRVALGGTDTRLRHMQVLEFLAERLEELGDEVPWVRPVNRKVIVHSHPEESQAVCNTTNAVFRVLKCVPGVEVVGGLLERFWMDGFCYNYLDLPRRPAPTTHAEMQQMRHELASFIRSKGADTVSAQHQDCNRIWAPFASVDLAILSPVAIVAEALGCAHPDRSQAAAILGDPEAVVEQTRPIWTSWGISEDKAREIAQREFGGVNTAKGTIQMPVATADGCGACGPGGCSKKLVNIDVVRGIDWESATRVAAAGDGAIREGATAT
jgi:transcriptional regulator with XRE-family HTH domain